MGIAFAGAPRTVGAAAARSFANSFRGRRSRPSPAWRSASRTHRYVCRTTYATRAKAPHDKYRLRIDGTIVRVNAPLHCAPTATPQFQRLAASKSSSPSTTAVTAAIAKGAAWSMASGTIPGGYAVPTYGPKLVAEHSQPVNGVGLYDGAYSAPSQHWTPLLHRNGYPLYAICRLPGFNAVFTNAYRSFARNRHCISGQCSIDSSHHI